MRRGWILLAAVLLAGCSAPPNAKLEALPIPAGGPRFDAAVARLLARPARPAVIPPGAACPVDDSRATGPGPLYPSARRLAIRPHDRRGPDGLYPLKNLWLSSEGAPGPVVVRVAGLDGERRGRVTLLYNDAMSRGDAVVFPIPVGAEDWPSLTFVSGPGCYAYQLEGEAFSMTVVFSVTVQH